jgi:hypothetical protein
MSTQKDRIEKLETDVQKLVEENTKRFAGVDKALENIASSIKELSIGFSGGLNKNNGENSQNSSKESRDTHHSSGHGHHRDRKEDGSYVCPLKMDFPRFFGEEPIIWLDRVAQYFELQQTLEEQKVTLAAFYLEGEANQWWQWLKKIYAQDAKPLVWETFEQDLLARFGPTDYEDFDEALSHIEQKGTVREYQQEFECLANRVVDWPEKALVGTFLGGLQPDIANPIKMFKPRTLRETIQFAQMQEDQMKRAKPFLLEQTKEAPRDDSVQPTSIQRSNVSLPPTKKLSWEAMQKRREKGLCFNCDERFTPGHRCEVKHLFIIEAEPGEGQGRIGENFENEQLDEI